MFRRRHHNDVCPFQPSDKLRRRVAAMSTAELRSWCEQALYEVGRSFSDMEGMNAEDAALRLEDGVSAAKVVLAILEQVQYLRKQLVQPL